MARHHHTVIEIGSDDGKPYSVTRSYEDEVEVASSSEVILKPAKHLAVLQTKLDSHKHQVEELEAQIDVLTPFTEDEE